MIAKKAFAPEGDMSDGFEPVESALRTNHYLTLGVPEHASQRLIRDAYRRAVQRCHPDRFQDQPEAEAVFKEITIAYKVLRDPRTRRDYDRRLGLAGMTGGRLDAGVRDDRDDDRDGVDGALLQRLELLADVQGGRGLGAPKIASRLIAEGAPYQLAWTLAWRARRQYLARTLDGFASGPGVAAPEESDRPGWQGSRDRHRRPLSALLARLTGSSR